MILDITLKQWYLLIFNFSEHNFELNELPEPYVCQQPLEFLKSVTSISILVFRDLPQLIKCNTASPLIGVRSRRCDLYIRQIRVVFLPLKKSVNLK